MGATAETRRAKWEGRAKKAAAKRESSIRQGNAPPVDHRERRRALCWPDHRAAPPDNAIAQPSLAALTISLRFRSLAVNRPRSSPWNRTKRPRRTSPWRI